MPFPLPADDVSLHLTRLGHDVFTRAYVDAMRPTLLLPVVVLALCALACATVRRRPPAAAPAN